MPQSTIHDHFSPKSKTKGPQIPFSPVRTGTGIHSRTGGSASARFKAHFQSSSSPAAAGPSRISTRANDDAQAESSQTARRRTRRRSPSEEQEVNYDSDDDFALDRITLTQRPQRSQRTLKEQRDRRVVGSSDEEAEEVNEEDEVADEDGPNESGDEDLQNSRRGTKRKANIAESDSDSANGRDAQAIDKRVTQADAMDVSPPKRGRGRPRKVQPSEKADSDIEDPPKRGRGRPRNVEAPSETVLDEDRSARTRRGRPRKVTLAESEDSDGIEEIPGPATRRSMRSGDTDAGQDVGRSTRASGRMKALPESGEDREEVEEGVQEVEAEPPKSVHMRSTRATRSATTASKDTSTVRTTRNAAARLPSSSKRISVSPETSTAVRQTRRAHPSLSVPMRTTSAGTNARPARFSATSRAAATPGSSSAATGRRPVRSDSQVLSGIEIPTLSAEQRARYSPYAEMRSEQTPEHTDETGAHLLVEESNGDYERSEDVQVNNEMEETPAVSDAAKQTASISLGLLQQDDAEASSDQAARVVARAEGTAVAGASRHAEIGRTSDNEVNGSRKDGGASNGAHMDTSASTTTEPQDGMPLAGALRAATEDEASLGITHPVAAAASDTADALTSTSMLPRDPQPSNGVGHDYIAGAEANKAQTAAAERPPVDQSGTEKAPAEPATGPGHAEASLDIDIEAGSFRPSRSPTPRSRTPQRQRVSMSPANAPTSAAHLATRSTEPSDSTGTSTGQPAQAKTIRKPKLAARDPDEDSDNGESEQSRIEIFSSENEPEKKASRSMDKGKQKQTAQDVVSRGSSAKKNVPATDGKAGRNGKNLRLDVGRNGSGKESSNGKRQRQASTSSSSTASSASAPAQRQAKKTKPNGRKRARDPDGSSSSDPESNEDTESDGQPSRSTRTAAMTSRRSAVPKTSYSSRSISGKQASKPIAQSAISRKKGKKARKARDPDSSGSSASTSDEEDMLAEILLDETDRFKTDSRLRRKKKETPAQRSMRKLRARRLGIIEVTSSSSGSSGDDSDTDSRDGVIGRTDSGEESDFVKQRTQQIDRKRAAAIAEEKAQLKARQAKKMRIPTSAKPFASSRNAIEVDSGDDTDDFIEDDGGIVPDHLLPHQFSLNSTQSPEYKYKVVFHYLLLLVMGGPKTLPLKGDLKEYLMPNLHDLRRRLGGLKDGSVRSQIWRTDFVRALEKYPQFDTDELDFAEPGCDACHISTRMSSKRVQLGGYAYDRETHEPFDSSSGDSDDSDDSADSEDSRSKGPPNYLMGKYCHARAQVYHALCHWEDDLYGRIKHYYHDLLRALDKPVPDDSEASSSDEDSDSDSDTAQARARRRDLTARRERTAERVKRLQKGRLVKKGKERNVDDVMAWMDEKGYPKTTFMIMENLNKRAMDLKYDKSRDD